MNTIAFLVPFVLVAAIALGVKLIADREARLYPTGRKPVQFEPEHASGFLDQTREKDNKIASAPNRRRIYAWILDKLLLAAFSYALGLFFFDFYLRIGNWTRLIGFAIALAYFGFMNSAVFGGQTVGKRLTKVRVVRADGSALTLAQSCARFTILAFSMLMFALPVRPVDKAAFVVTLGLSLGFDLCVWYLFLFNRPTRQSVHDLVVGSYVINAALSKPVQTPRPRRFHYVIAVLLIAFGGVVPLMSAVILRLQSPLQPSPRSIWEEPSVIHSSIYARETVAPPAFPARPFLTVTVNRKIDYERFATRCTKAALEAYPLVWNREKILTRIEYGYTDGLSFQRRRIDFNLTPGEWAERIQKELTASPRISSSRAHTSN